MIGRKKIVAPKYPGNSRTCEYVTLHGKRDFAGGTSVKDLEIGDYPGSAA